MPKRDGCNAFESQMDVIAIVSDIHVMEVTRLNGCNLT